MDKFGVFKLLGSFFDFYMKNKPDKSGLSDGEKPDVFKTVSDIFNNNSSARKDGFLNSSETQGEKTARNGERKPAAPLQNSMLSVMINHDRAVKRVRDNLHKKR